ncbi:helix-turn-helix domain-containing protein [Haloechinothrix salitolerans]|uniref:Helix-turn-helix domain-containing protein n=1 Tax=Haloechinothrix salitolerans TaxID=926830 RepID=A0ABW2BXA1_9PSEU
MDDATVSDSERDTRLDELGRFDELGARRGDLTVYARIREAALTLFADRGVEATSIRDIARAAGVSPGVVQHHFGTKAGLRAEINQWVRRHVEEAFAYLPGLVDPNTEEWTASRFAELAEERGTTLRYLVRALADGDKQARGVFDSLVAVASRYRGEQDARDQVILMLGKALIRA